MKKLNARRQVGPAGTLVQVWIVGAAFALLLIWRDFSLLNHGLVGDGAFIGRDFINVWTGGWMVWNDRIASLYDLDAYGAVQRSLFGAVEQHNYSYPPLTLPLTMPFALLPYWLAFLLWLGGTGWLFVRAARPWMRNTGWPGWVVVLTPAGLVNIWAGHYGFLVGALVLSGWRWLPDRPRLAGVCFGLLAIKPHLAVLIPLILLLRRDWEAIVAAALTVAALLLMSLVIFGVQPWIDYFTVTAGVQAAMVNANGATFGFMSTSTATAMLAYGWHDLAAPAQIMMGLLGVSFVARAARVVDTKDLATLTATATFLVLPYAFNYDLTVSSLGALLLLVRSDVRPWEQFAAVFGFMAATLAMMAAIKGVHVMPLLLLGLAMAQYHVAMRTARGEVSPTEPLPAAPAAAAGAR